MSHPIQLPHDPVFDEPFTEADLQMLRGIANTKLWDAERGALLRALREIKTLRKHLAEAEDDLEAAEAAGMDRDLLT